MMLAFILIAGSLVAGATVLLLLPLVRRREDKRPAAGLAAGGMLVILLLGGGMLYAAFSNYSWVEMPDVADTPAAMAAKLAKRLAAEPDDLEGWLMLGRTYGTLEQFPLAVRAYQRADRLANGQNADAIVGVAEMLLAQDFEQIRGAAGHLFDRALVIEPDNPKALLYSAFAALSRGEQPAARERFQRLLTLNPPPQIRDIIDRQLQALDAAASSPLPQVSPVPQVAQAQGPKVAVHVTLAPALAGKVPAGAALFVAARDPKSPGPPFAVKRLPAAFPVDVELSAADAMLESRRIADGQQLEVIARVALGGTPTATSGDPFGQVSYHVGQDKKLNIVIDRLAP
jgi:cytochrome c-type biogenesis protein CcmH